MTKDAKEAVHRLQLIEQNVQNLNSQKQQFQAQLFEVEGALKEVSLSENTFKVIGGIMVQVPQSALKTELSGKKELLELRVQTLEKQEEQLKEKARKLQEQIMGAKE